MLASARPIQSTSTFLDVQINRVRSERSVPINPIAVHAICNKFHIRYAFFGKTPYTRCARYARYAPDGRFGHPHGRGGLGVSSQARRRPRRNLFPKRTD